MLSFKMTLQRHTFSSTISGLINIGLLYSCVFCCLNTQYVSGEKKDMALFSFYFDLAWRVRVLEFSIVYTLSTQIWIIKAISVHNFGAFVHTINRVSLSLREYENKVFFSFERIFQMPLSKDLHSFSASVSLSRHFCPYMLSMLNSVFLSELSFNIIVFLYYLPLRAYFDPFSCSLVAELFAFSMMTFFFKKKGCVYVRGKWRGKYILNNSRSCGNEN